jgi:hypothetical protein
LSHSDTVPGDDARARQRDAFVGGPHALIQHLDVAEQFTERFGAMGPLVRSAWTWHRHAATWALAATPARSVIFVSAGFGAPDGAPLHHPAAADHPAARFAYADEGPKTVAMTRALIAAKDPGRVVAFVGHAADSAGVLEAPEAKWALRGAPVSVQMILALHWLPGDTAARVLNDYGTLLPAGSTVCLTMGIPDPSPAGQALAAASSGFGGQFYAHTEADLGRWIGQAPRMRLHRQGIRNTPVWAVPPAAVHPAARIVDAVAVVALA